MGRTPSHTDVTILPRRATMDFEILFWIVIILFYLIFQVRGAARRKKKGPPRPTETLPQPTGRPGEATAEPTLDDALREIRIALGMEVPEQEEPVPEGPKPEPARATAPTRLEKVLPEPATRTRPTPPPVPAEQPREFRPIPVRYADAEFESSPTAFGSTPSIHREPAITRSLPKSPKPPPALKEEALEVAGPKRKASARVLVRRLQDPEAAREAFILGEILGPPRAFRRR